MKNHTHITICWTKIRRILHAGCRSVRVVNVAFIPETPRPVPVTVRATGVK